MIINATARKTAMPMMSAFLLSMLLEELWFSTFGAAAGVGVRTGDEEEDEDEVMGEAAAATAEACAGSHVVPEGMANAHSGKVMPLVVILSPSARGSYRFAVQWLAHSLMDSQEPTA